ncbi:Kinesin-like protein kif27 [Chytriomyces hyalinus]|nr:Kinesin-like protein kif27 [Chytriomyces hyalinus]
MNNIEALPVTVAVRVRPPSATSNRFCVGVNQRANAVFVSREDSQPNTLQNGSSNPASNSNLTSSGPHGHNNSVHLKKSFSFDKVHGIDSSQLDLYNASCSGLVAQFVDGFNVTIFAYGQTSSGKTYTMGSSNTAETPEKDLGIIPRVVNQVMDLIKIKQAVDPNISFTVRCTFLEIYQEQVRDLLMPGEKEISIREDRNGSVTVSGIHEEPVHSARHLFRCLERGGVERTTGDTKMHQQSSRSHAVFTLILEQRLDATKIVGMETDQETWGSSSHSHASRLLRCSKLHLVDLAGSERVKRTGAEGVRLKESVKINSGLLALGNVISVLGEMQDSAAATGSVSTTHVPYRDSKLTRLLQNSLGGNAKTLMLACVSPCDEDYEETINTLKYADRARKIQNKPVINTIDFQAVKLASMQEKIDFLESQLQKQNGVNAPQKFEELAQRDGKVLSLAQEPELTDMENDKIVAYFVEELKNRTIRGTNAIRALQEMTNEKTRLSDRIETLEERLHDSRLSAEEAKSTYSKMTNENQDLRGVQAKLEKYLNCVLDALESAAHLYNDQQHMAIWQKLRDRLQPEKWQQLSSLCDAYRPNLMEEQFQVQQISLPPISDTKDANITLSQPSSRKGSAFGTRFQRRNSKVTPVNAKETEIINSSESNLRAALSASETEKAALDLRLQQMEFERTQDSKILLEQTALIHTLQSAKNDLEDQLTTASHVVHRDLRSFETQTDEPAVFAVAAEKESPYKHFTTAELIDAIGSKNRELELSVNKVTLPYVPLTLESVSDMESIKLLSRVNDDDPHVSFSFPVHLAQTPAKGTVEKLVEEDGSSPDEESDTSEVTGTNASKSQILADYQATLKAKAELQRELGVRNKEMEKLKHQHNERVSKLERDLEASGRDVIRMKAELDAAHAQKEKVKEECDKRIKAYEAQVVKTKNKLKEQERVLKDKDASDRKAAEIQPELEKLQVALNNAKKKAKEDAEKMSELENRRIKDMSVLNRAREEDAKHIRQLEIAAEVVRKKLDRKNEELSVLSKKLKDGIAVANVSKPAKVKSSLKNESNQTDVVVSPVEKILSVTVLEAAPEIRTLEQENEKFRNYHSVCSKIRTVKDKIDALGLKMAEMDQSQESEHVLQELKSERKTLARELSILRENRQKAEAALDELGSDLSLQPATRPQTVDSDRINYAALSKEFEGDSDALDILNRLPSASLQESRAMVISCLRELVELHTLETNFELESQQSTEEITGLREKYNRMKESFELKLQKLQKPVTLESGCQTESPQSSLTSDAKDLEYYKQSSRDLKMKLRELVALNHNLARQIEAGESQQSVKPSDIAPAAL